MQHPGFLQDFNKIMAWLAFNDKNFTRNQNFYIIDPLTFEVSVDGIIMLSESVGFIRVKFKEVQGFEAQNSSLISLLGCPKFTIQRFFISNAKNLLSFDGITEFSNTLVIMNCLCDKLPSYVSIKKATCVHLELFERGKVDLRGMNDVFRISRTASLEYYKGETITAPVKEVVKGGLEILNLTVNHNEESIDVRLRTPKLNLSIIQKYLNKDNPRDYVMDCYMELVDSGHNELAEM